jgi:hypothetical protein
MKFTFKQVFLSVQCALENGFCIIPYQLGAERYAALIPLESCALRTTFGRNNRWMLVVFAPPGAAWVNARD